MKPALISIIMAWMTSTLGTSFPLSVFFYFALFVVDIHNYINLNGCGVNTIYLKSISRPCFGGTNKNTTNRSYDNFSHFYVTDFVVFLSLNETKNVSKSG